jgi:polysaccharide biosynthesis protein PslH
MTLAPNLYRPKIIFFAPILEYPPAGGPQLRAINAIKVLSRIAELHIVTTVAPEDVSSAEAQQFLRGHAQATVHAPSSKWRANNRIAARILRKGRRILAPAIAARDVDYIINYANAHRIDIFWIDRVLEHAFSVFTQLRRLRPKAIIVGDTDAVYTRFVLREIPFVSNPLRRMWITRRGRRKGVEERQLVTQADITTAVSEFDAEYFRSVAPDPTRVKLFSNVVDPIDYERETSSAPQLAQPYLLLLGSYGHRNSPMDRAARWLAHDIMPLVWAQAPNVHLYIIGRNADLTQANLANEKVTVIGQVPSVLPYLKNAAAMLVPLHFESGTRFKILESGAASVPCVSTTLGAEGLDVTDKENILIADTTTEFSRAIISILGKPDLATQLGRNLHALIDERYSLDVQTREAQAVLDHLHMRQARPVSEA